MKKLIAILTALVLMMSAAGGLGENAAETEIPAAAAGRDLPEAGEVIQGFEVTEKRDFEMIGAELVLFEHQKTGAKVMYIANGDINRAFQLSFLTRPLDDTGLPHVFEHATLYGSEKYPSKTLLFNATLQTYNTFINAFTQDAMTSYPLGSLSEEQLLRLADWYTDACFHPNIMTDESIFRTQAWHYEMKDAESPLTMEGTVYTEMVGAMTLERAAMDAANRTTFPGAAIAYDAGGVPGVIPQMTWESLKAFHDRYYHPSNCIAFLYGDLEHYESFLELLDREFSQYEKREFAGADEGYRALTEPVTSKVAYPTAEGTDSRNRSTVIYYILLPGMKGNETEEQVIDHVCSLLGSEASPLIQKLKKVLPTGSFGIGRELAAPDDAVVVLANLVNEEDGELFRQTVNETMKEIARDGLDATLVDAQATALKLQNKLATENGNPIEGVIQSMAYNYAVTGKPFSFAEKMAAYDLIGEEYASGAYEKAITEWLTDPEIYTLTTVYPAPGEKEKEDAALAAEMEAVKAGMSAEEIAQIVAESAEEPAEEDNSALMARLKAVDVKGLPEETREYDFRDETGEDGVRRINVKAGVDGVGIVQLRLDARHLGGEDVHYMRLFTRLMGYLDTPKHTKEELSVLAARYLNGLTIGVQVNPGETADEVQPWLIAQWTALDEDLENGYGLVKEMLTETQFTDIQVLSERIAAQKASVRSQISSTPYQASMMRGLGRGLMRDRYYDHLNFTDYYAFLERIEKKPEEAAEGLKRVQQKLMNRYGAVAGFAGNEESIGINAPLVTAFMADLPAEACAKAELNLEAAPGSEGLIVDTNTGFNVLTASFEELGIPADEGLNVAAALVMDQILVPVLRDQMGVYTPQCSILNEDEGIVLFTYRDPNVKETFEVYDGLPEKIEAMETDQETLDGYILSKYSALAKPSGELTGALEELERIVAGKDAGRKLERMRQLKAVTPEKIRESAEVFRKLSEIGYRGTAAGAGTVQNNAEMYEAVLNPFGAVDAGQTELTDVSGDRADYEAIRFAYENGLMTLTGENTFSPDEGATAGDLFAALYVLSGGTPGAPEEAMAAFGQAGLVPEGTETGTALSFGLRDQVMGAFGTAVGFSLPAIGEGREETVMTRGELAQDLMIFNQP